MIPGLGMAGPGNGERHDPERRWSSTGNRVGGPESVDLLSGCRSTQSFFVV